MPHQCVHCAKTYEDGNEIVLKGCPCGSKFFFYISNEKLKKLQEKNGVSVSLSKEEKEQVEQDVRDIIGIEEDEETPIVLDFESVKVMKPGKYLIDLHRLFGKEKPFVYHLEEGKYIVDLEPEAKKKASA